MKKQLKIKKRIEDEYGNIDDITQEDLIKIIGDLLIKDDIIEQYKMLPVEYKKMFSDYTYIYLYHEEMKKLL